MTAKSRRPSLLNMGWYSGLLLSAVGLLGCPGPNGAYYISQAYFANTTREPVKVRVQKLLADVACADVPGKSAELLARRELFGETITYEVAAGDALPLDLDDDGFSGSRRESCAVLVQLLGFPDQLVFWAPDALAASTESEKAQPKDAEFLGQSLRLAGQGDDRVLVAGEGLEVTALPPVSSDKAVSDPPVSLGWSGTPRNGNFALTRAVRLPDGCLSLQLGEDPDFSWSLFLCAPPWSFPFRVGHLLRVSFEAQHLTMYDADDQIRLEIWLNAVPGQVSQATSVSNQGTPGRHTACAAFVEPASVELATPPLVLLPGVDRQAIVAGQTLHVFLGRAEEVLVAPDACSPEYAALGTRFDLLLLSTPAEQSP